MGISCRRRKMRCDGVHPTCGQCARAGRAEDCEYTNGQRRARVEILQESIREAESRIYDLEHPHQAQSVVQLRQPYEATPPSRISSPRPQSSMVTDEPINTFLSYSSEFGFFLNAPRFRNSALIRQPIGHHDRPTPALLFAVYLCALRLTQDPSPQSIQTHLEPTFLSQALEFASQGLSSAHPQKMLHTLQAEILLAYYFFACGRFVEGRYHTATAVSLGLSSGLHLVRSSTTLGSSSHFLPPPQDATEEGERIHACWVLITLDRAWATAQGEHLNLDHEQQNVVVDTPWPLEMDDYARGLFNPTTRYSNTLHKFLNNISTSDTGMSTIAMFSKATILWQRAESFGREWSPGAPHLAQTQSRDFQRAFTVLDALIDAFRAALIPPNRIPHATPAMTRALVAAHSIAHIATIQLYNSQALQGHANARRKRLGAANIVLNIIVTIPLQHFAFIHPIMGTVWLQACQIIMDEIYARRNSGGRETELVLLLTRTADVLSSFEETCPLLSWLPSPSTLCRS
ncbi:hypothetical protein B0H16DRAFT_1829158 [Mycena metata]|uniref:Zn(2)-C6 fungal-type domain-containing protein n=1 Tax=Mycena metata TaxID=1033252 RepID=A0AAD7M711_9AGAR|nr:hypothetical protein B0H16DRAFT_1829158 [Mycena metata]